jgi:SAM-dependent methyltransferase
VPGTSTELRSGPARAVAEALAGLTGSAPDGGCVVVDVGGGTGGLAVPLAVAGHHVTVLDPSPDALAALARRARETEASARVRPVQGDLDDLPRLLADTGPVDAVLCHQVLEVVEDRAAAMRAVAAAVRPGGVVSVLVANRLAVVLQRALAGRFAEALAAVAPRSASGPIDRSELEDLVAAAGLVAGRVHGVRVVSDYLRWSVPGGAGDSGAPEEVAALEAATSGHGSLRDIATQLHVLAHQPG